MLGMEFCPGCKCATRYPVDWREQGMEFWWVMVRCGNCGEVASGVHRQSTVEAFDDVLDAGRHALCAELERVVHENMSDEVERFGRALAADAIGPEDFAGGG